MESARIHPERAGCFENVLAGYYKYGSLIQSGQNGHNAFTLYVPTLAALRTHSGGEDLKEFLDNQEAIFSDSRAIQTAITSENTEQLLRLSESYNHRGSVIQLTKATSTIPLVLELGDTQTS
ncbi:hypothetical protein Trydic_g1133 [Trypoxylus dichotomus]